MGDKVQFYMSSIRLYLKSRVLHWNFIVSGIIAVVLLQLARFGLIWVILNKFGEIKGWGFSEIGFLFGFWLVAHGLSTLFFRQLWNFDWFVERGELDKYLLRPRNVFFQLAASRLEPIGLGDLLPGIVLVIYGGISTGLNWSLGGIILSVIILFGAMLIEVAIALLVATVSFWTVQSRALNLLVSETQEHLIRYPITIYSKPMMIVLSFILPIAFMNYFPAKWILGKHDLVFSPLWSYMTPVVGVIFFFIAYQVWRFGISRYQSTGS